MTSRIVPEDDHFSVSRVNMWHRCPKQYEYRYLQGLKTPPALRPLAGKAGHGGLEAHMREKLRTGIDPPLSVMHDAFAQTYQDERYGLELEPEENEDATKDYVAKTLTRYHTNNAPFVQPRAIEQQFLLPLIGQAEQLPPLLGYIDIIKVPLDGPPTLDVDDFKFKFPDARGYRARPMTQDDVDSSDQLTAYEMVMDAAGVRVDRLGFQTLIGPSPRDPVPAIIPVYRDERLLHPTIRQRIRQRLIDKIEAMVKSIRHGIFVPTNNPRTCSWCGYRKICPASLAKDDFLAQQLREGTEVAAP